MPRALRRMTNEQRDAAERYIPLARAIAARVIHRLGWGKSFDGDEVVAAALFGLCKRMSHCPCPEGPLKTYLSRWIDLEIRGYLGYRHSRHTAEITSAEMIDLAPADEIDDDPRIDRFVELVQELPPRQAEAIHGILAGLSTRELAASMGVSQPTIRALIGSAVDAMRRRACMNSA